MGLSRDGSNSTRPGKTSVTRVVEAMAAAELEAQEASRIHLTERGKHVLAGAGAIICMAAGVGVSVTTEAIIDNLHQAPVVGEVKCADEQVPEGLSYNAAAIEIVRETGVQGVNPNQVDADLRDKYGVADTSSWVRIEYVGREALTMNVGHCQ